MTDLGGSLAVASRGLFATGVSTDLSGKKPSADMMPLMDEEGVSRAKVTFN